ncbi:succinyl-3-ketoacid-coenzyme a transferase [Purpureocillium lilacinum]|uniref:Succinyl-3-ketoacid-coenzyme a transferase n=1 Tax=Purpureocillium lilacinum TaxID=33203 RepID=A0A179HUL0_PURLI|nr:succinyl-3-ketoacid-coenzyme a transferase [Purpureocillium lilacinum]OAQ93080.1 succinyl-3-ketoacid-coenzyme a transferase [Purpureocillium lilacinum]
MFDQSSGQVFKEWTLSRNAISPSGDGLDWSRRRPYPLFQPRGTRGPRSLLDTSINVIANNIGDITAEHLEGIPDRLQWHIWRFLEARGVCLHAWKLFSKLLLQEGDDRTLGLYRFRQHICRPVEELSSYTQPLTSLTFDFITHLVIAGGCEFSTNELLCLTSIKNLGVLELIQPADEVCAVFSQVNDRLIRGWTEMEDPFPLLRILRIWGDHGITQKSLRLVSKFPALAMYDILGSREDWPSPGEQAHVHGWELAQPVSGLEDSLLRYLMLLAPIEDTRNVNLRELARSVDTDLVSLCSDSLCVVKFMPDRQAPALLDYLTDAAKVDTPVWDPDAASRDSRSCHDVAFEPWAFWLYSFIGQIGQDRDLESKSVCPDLQAAVGPFVLPSKPMACLFLGHSGRGGITSKPSYVSRGLFSTTRQTFTRPSVVYSHREAENHVSQREELDKTEPERLEPSLRRQKRQRLDDFLKSFST